METITKIATNENLELWSSFSIDIENPLAPKTPGIWLKRKKYILTAEESGSFYEIVSSSNVRSYTHKVILA